MTCFEIYHGDAKRFSFRNDTFSGSVYWGTCEFKGKTYMDEMLKKVDMFQYEMRAFKKEKCLSFAFLSLVDIENLRTVLIIADEASRLLANQAFTKKQKWKYDEDNVFEYVFNLYLSLSLCHFFRRDRKRKQRIIKQPDTTVRRSTKVMRRWNYRKDTFRERKHSFHLSRE